MVTGSLEDVGIRSAINEGSTTSVPHVGGEGTLAKDSGEIVLGGVVNLLITGSAEVDAI